MLGFRFSYLYKLHTESFMGFNAVCLSGNPPGAFYRSSLPATPVSTPIRENGRFSAQALRERLCRTPSPRKYRLFEPRASEPDIGFNSLEVGLQLSSPDDEIDENAPFHLMKPRLEQLELESSNIPATRLKRRIFVGNLGYCITKRELQDFFSKFGRVVDCLIVQDHIKKRPRGYGFVIFSNQDDAEKARRASAAQLEYDGRVLKVLSCEQKKNAKYRREARELLFQQGYGMESLDAASVDSNYKQRICRSSSLQNINEMNEDILLLIFSYLSIRDRIKLELVCKKWQHLALKLWHSSYSLHLKNEFNIFDNKPLTNDILYSLLKKCDSKLRKLDLSEASHILDYKSVEIIAMYCPNLEFIDLTSVKVTNVSVRQLAVNCPKIKHAVFLRCVEVGEKGIWWLLHLCKAMEHINLTGNPRITGQCFHMASPTMREVILNGCTRFSPSGFMKVATRCRQLVTLHLNDCFKLTDRALELLCQSLRNLKELHVGGIFHELTSMGLHHIGRLNNLEKLLLAQNNKVDDDVIYAVSRGCRKLRFLDISSCSSGVTDAALTSLSSCYQLRTLYVNYLHKVSDEGLSAMSRQGNLQVLRIRGCRNVGDQGLLTLVMLSPHLYHLDVSGCENVTNATVSACLDSVQARSPSTKLLLIVGGTHVELEALELDSTLLEVSRMNYCDDNFTCSAADAYYNDEENMEPEVFAPAECEGAVGGDILAAAASTSEIDSDAWAVESPL